ncbi:MAG: cell division protein FtsL [Spirochaetaceae bacterium]|nr:cell division protein FtsL [Spirochaetaceae bacterium]
MAKKIGLYAVVLSIPLFLLGAVWQGERYAALRTEVDRLTERQEKVIEENRRLIAEITVLSSSARIENIAKTSLGLEKKAPEEVIEVTIKSGTANSGSRKTGG